MDHHPHAVYRMNTLSSTKSHMMDTKHETIAVLVRGEAFLAAETRVTSPTAENLVDPMHTMEIFFYEFMVKAIGTSCSFELKCLITFQLLL
jgi:hypothetical protein